MAQMLAVALVPIFFGLILGYWAGLRKLVDNVNVRTLVSLVMNFALPCSLFLAIVKTPRPILSSQGRMIVLLAAVYLLLFAATYAFSRKMLRASSRDGAVLALTLGFPNVTAVGIPLLDAVYGPQTAVTVAMGITVGAMTISPITLAILEHGAASGKAMTSFARARRAIWRALSRPVVWAPAVALVAVFCNINLPAYATRSLSVMGAATAGCALFLTGLIVSAQKFILDWRSILATLAKNIIQPAVCLGIALAMALPVDQTRCAVLVAAIPCGFFGLVFGKGFDVSPLVASSSLILSYLLGIASLAAWIVLLGHLH